MLRMELYLAHDKTSLVRRSQSTKSSLDDLESEVSFSKGLSKQLTKVSVHCRHVYSEILCYFERWLETCKGEYKKPDYWSEVNYIKIPSSHNINHVT